MTASSSAPYGSRPSRVLGLIKGVYDGTDGYLPQDQLDQLRKSGKVNIDAQQSMRLAVIQINTQKPPLNDVHVRRAISYAFNYKAFIHDILKGRVVRNPVPIPKNLWGYPKGIKGYSFNLKKAKQELAKAKSKVNRTIDIHPMIGYNQTSEIAQILQNGLTQIGIKTKIVPETLRTFNQKAASPRQAQYVDPLGKHLLPGSKQLDRRNVQFQQLGHLESLKLLQE